MAQAGGGQVATGLTVREWADNARAPSDLAHQPLQRIISANTPPVFVRKGIKAQRLFDRFAQSVGQLRQLHRSQLVLYVTRLGERSLARHAGVNGVEHQRHFTHLAARNLAQAVAVPMNRTALPQCFGIDFGCRLHQPQTGIRYDQLHALQATFLQMLDQASQPALSSLWPSQMPRISR